MLKTCNCLRVQALALQCGACGALQSAAAGASTSGLSWHCQACTLENPASVNACSACGAQRNVTGGTGGDTDTVMLPADGFDVSASTSRKGKESVVDGGGSLQVGQGVIDLEGVSQPPAIARRPCESVEDAGSGVQLQKGWACKFCTLMNEPRLSKCAACEEWRYSFGAPLTHRPVTET